ncbi:MAG: chorismate mutase [Saprospiraceae bacterium]|nr:chorismate mutase [Saprospiraceae bacterium]
MNHQEKIRVAIQGYEGSFHHVASLRYWGKQETEVIPADSFDDMAKFLKKDQADIAVMAIENSIAGTILQNYRILRENGFWVNGDIYLRIRHHLLTVQNATLEDIREVASHPMAINQCREFLRNFPHWKLLESEDTALSAKIVAQKAKISKACIASEEAAKIHGLKILKEGIETSKSNYTRFFIVSPGKTPIPPDANKASVYIRIPDRKGQLLKVLEVIQHHNLNMSKLQSFPVVGSFREYFFHLDIEFEHISQYAGLKEDLLNLTFEYDELGIYKSADISDILKNHNQLYTEI